MRVYEAWKTDAQCRGHDPELWFSKHDGERRGSKAVQARDLEAKAICLDCPVVSECLSYAIALDLRYGTWGGFTEGERAKLTGRRPE
jgi:WhiB family redox-sensing transcriptional regulator